MKDDKESLLKANRYRYNFDRMVYFNRDAKKAFSVEWLDDHSAEELRQALSERNENSDWQLYVDVRPSQSVIEAFLAEVNG